METITKIEYIRELDDELFEIFEQTNFLILNQLSKGEIPKTSELLLMFMTSSNFIKNAILDCLENDDIYSANILFRSLIEHFLRFKFICFKYLKEKSDKQSEYYLTILEISEHLSFSKSINAVNKINGIDNQTINEMWSELCEKFPHLKKYTKKEIEEFSRQISIKNIIAYLTEVLESEEKNEQLLSKMIIEYSDLSSFVHGGVFAFKSCYKLSNDEVRQKESERIAGLTFRISGAIKSISYLIFYQFNKEFGSLLLQTEEILRKYK
ncbi:hypothetical protein KDU71_15255 [Carboxylicivirga sediminis]|uniref:Uncharacterized protein n=1 Tax=Carboxylicivirga sediminis TaxID=2006564 RepID=A0A941F777_9BACT|nr:DUF5677 domain-containing protein [Carboxylicivirga sediminis]MBR8536929.1 hypothetical protein [Carboxylicivirga sediminis]